MNDAKQQRLDLSPSSAFAGVLFAVHAAAAGCILTTLTGFSGLLVAALALALGGTAAWDRALLRGRRSPRAIEIASSGEARVVLANGASVPVRAVGGIGVTRHWVALASGSLTHRSALVTTGMLGPAAARSLRLWSLWGRTRGAAAGAGRQPG